MTIRGHYQNGVVVLDETAAIAEGTSVIVEILPSNLDVTDSHDDSAPLGKQLLRFAGIVNDTPSDLAQNHDRYINERHFE